MPIGVFEAELAFAEIDLTGDAGVHHPLEGAVDGGPADPLILTPDQIDQIFGGEVTLLTKKDVDDPKSRLSTACCHAWQAIEIRRRRLRLIIQKARS